MKRTDKRYDGKIPFYKGKFGMLAESADPRDPQDLKDYVWRPNVEFTAQLRLVGEHAGWSGVSMFMGVLGDPMKRPLYRMNNADFWDMLEHTTLVNGVTAMETWTFRRTGGKYSLCLVHA